MGNRSKRGRRDPDAPDPVEEWQEESRWSAYTRHIRWPFVAGWRMPRGSRLRSTPTLWQWMGAAFVIGAVVVLVVVFITWLARQIF